MLTNDERCQKKKKMNETRTHDAALFYSEHSKNIPDFGCFFGSICSELSTDIYSN